MKICIGVLSLALLIALTGPATAEFDKFVDWAAVNGSVVVNPSPSDGFGDILSVWSPGIGSVISICYDPEADGIWFASEASNGILYLMEAGGAHAILRQINIMAFGWTSDGNQDGVALDLDNRMIYVCDYNGDLTISDDIIYGIDYDTGALVDVWHIDGALNPNPSAYINGVIDICMDGQGNLYAGDIDGYVHHITLEPGGTWTQIVQMLVPGGGVWGGLDYDECLDAFFTGNFSTAVYGYNADPLTTPMQSFMAPTGQASGITSDEVDRVWTCTFSDNMVYEHEGIACSPTPINETTWGNLKSIFK